MKKYIIEVNDKQLEMIRDACEACSRIGMYQLHDICNFLPNETEEQKLVYQEIYDLLWENYLHYTLSLSTNDRVKTETCNILWDIYQVTRHKLAWDKNPKGDNMNVSYDKPMKTSKENLITIKEIE